MSDTATPPETTTPPAETPPDNITRRPLNRWRSHKVVDADKIASIDANVVTATEEEQKHRLILGTEPDAPIVTVTQAWFERHRPQVGGYFVRYSDDYESYSPADSFEKGYNPFEAEASDPEGFIKPETPAPAAARKTRGLNFGEAMTALVEGLDVHLDGTTLRKTDYGVFKISNGVAEALPVLPFTQEAMASKNWSIIE